MPSGASSSSERCSPSDVALVCTTADRLTLALELLRDPAFDVLVTGESRFDELPGVMERLAEGSLPALTPRRR